MVDSPALPPLSVNELLFVNEYLANGRHATHAWQSVRPKLSYKSASEYAVVVLRKPQVQAEIAKRVQHEAGITRELVESNLLVALQLANNAKDAAVIASVTMDCAKLAGFLIERREVKTISDAEQSSVKELVSRTLRTTIPHGMVQPTTATDAVPASAPTLDTVANG